MTIAVKCTNCGKVLEVKPELAGKRGKCPGCGALLEVPGSDARRKAVRRPTPRRGRVTIDLPIGKVGCVLAVVVGIWCTWHFGIQPFGERFRMQEVFERAFVGRLKEATAELEAMREDISGGNRDRLELRIAQVKIMGVAVEGMMDALRAAGDRDSFLNPLDLEVIVSRAMGAGADSGPPVRLRNLKVDSKGRARLYSLTVENASDRPLALKNEYFFRCQVTVETDKVTGALLQRVARVAPVANVNANSLDGVQVPPGGSAEGVVAFFGGTALVGPPVRDESGRRKDVRVLDAAAVVFTDGKVCAVVRDTTL